MTIKLKNGTVVRVAWNWLVIERLESTVGSLNTLTKKNITKRGEGKTMGDIAYAVLQANMDEEMRRNDLLSLVDFNDIKRISEFVAKNNEQTDDFVGKKNSKGKNNRNK